MQATNLSTCQFEELILRRHPQAAFKGFLTIATPLKGKFILEIGSNVDHETLVIRERVIVM